jgi:hypothetical protein
MPLLAMLFRYRYVTILLAVVVCVGGAWLHGFFKGKSYAEVKIINKVVEADRESRRGAEDVRLKTQNLSEPELDSSLCDLGIVWDGTGCK